MKDILATGGLLLALAWPNPVAAQSNHAPVMAPRANVTQLAGTSASMQITASDADGQSLTYGATGLPPGVTIDVGSGLISGVLSASTVGTYNVTLTASDGALTATSAFNWYIVDAHAKVWDSFSGAQGASLGSHVPEIAPSGATWQHTAGIGSATLQSGAMGATGPLDDSYQIWTIGSGAADAVVAVDVTSGSNVKQYGGLVFRETDANNYFMLRFNGPYLYKVQDGSLAWVAQGTTPMPMVGGRAYRLEVHMQGSQISVYWDGQLQFQTTSIFQQAATRHGLMWNPLEDQTALLDNFTVSSLDGPPVMSGPGDQLGVEGTNVSISIGGSDPDGNTLSYTATGLPPGVGVNAATGLIAGTLGYGTAGLYPVVLTASDGILTASRSVTWRVLSRGTTVFDTFTGADGTSLMKHAIDVAPPGAAWTHTSGIGSGSLQGGSAIATGPLDQSYQIWTLDAGASDATVAVDVNTTNVSKYGGLVFRASDADNYFMLRFNGPYLYKRQGGSLSWLAQGPAPVPMVSGHTYRLEVRTTGNVIKVYWDGVFQFQTTDSFQQTATRYGLMWNPLEDQTASLDNFEVSAPHGIPVITGPSNQTAEEGTFLSVPITAFDIEGAPLSYAATGLPPGLSVNTATGVMSGTSALGSEDTYAVTMFVSNGSNAASRTFLWSVSAPGDQTRIFDTFSGGPLTLSNHLLDAAPPMLRWKWLTGVEIPIVGGGEVYSADAPHEEAWGIDVGLSDVIVAADVRSTDASPWGGVVLRETDPQHYLAVLMNGATDSPRLYMRSGDDYVWLASGQASFGPGVSRRLRVRAVGNLIEAYVDGVLQLSATTSFNQTATSHGLIWYPIEDPTLRFDDFELRSDQPIQIVPGNGCTSTVSPLSMAVGPDKGTYSVQVWAPPGCDWSFQAETDDIVEEGPRTASSASFSIQNNTQAVSRTALVVVGGHTVTITQRGLGPSSTCSYAVTPQSMNVGAASGSGQIAVTAQSGCTWTAFSPDAFVHINSGSASSGTGAVAFTFDDNTTTGARSSVFDVAGYFIVVTQSAVGSGGCDYSIAPTPPLDGGDSSEVVTIAAPIGCQWSATSEADFLQVSGNATGNGPGSFMVSATANPDHEERSGTLQVAGQEMTLFQMGAAGEPFCVAAVTPLSITLPAIGGQGVLVVDAPSGCQWSASSGESWLNLNPTNGASVSYTVGPNDGDERAILLTIGLIEVSVNQEGATPTGITGADIVWQAPTTDKVPDRCLGNCGAGCGTFFGVCGGGHWTMSTLNEPQLLGTTLRDVCTAGQTQLGVFPRYSAMVTWTYHGVFSVGCWDHDRGCQNQLNPLNHVPFLRDIWCLLSAGPSVPDICVGARPQTWSYSELEVGTTLFPTAIIFDPIAPACGEP